MTKNDIVIKLQELGLIKGDLVLLHSALSSLGYVEGGARAVVDAFLEVLGSEGTLAVPTFGNLGIITSVLKEDPRAVKSIHPLAGIAAIGKDAEYLCAEHWKAATAHGEDTPYTRLAEKGGYVCLLGVDQDRNTTLHSVEALLKLPYLSNRTASLDTPEGHVTKSWSCLPGPHRDFIALDKSIHESGNMQTGKIGNAVVRLMKSRDLIDFCLDAGRKDPAFVLCDNPNCADCVSQRAALNRAYFDQESFTLSVSSLLAGYYVPEIIDNCQRAGIANLDLDYLMGKPVHLLESSVLEGAVSEFTNAGIDISAMRFQVIPGDLEQYSGLGLERMVFPLINYEHLFKECDTSGLTLSFYNTPYQNSEQITQSLLALKEKCPSVKFTFNAANFCKAGEKPFLFSFKHKLRHFIDQLDIGDACFDATYTALAKGNAEIKELISILRCSSFQGYLNLGRENLNLYPSLRELVKDFNYLLNHM